MTIEAERRWLMIALARLQVDLGQRLVRTVGSGKVT
jgi:hypothetical protein